MTLADDPTDLPEPEPNEVPEPVAPVEVPEPVAPIEVPEPAVEDTPESA